MIKNTISRIKSLLSRLSFRTGVVVLIICVLFYILSFVQALLPFSVATKSTLFVVFFGMAKLTQYTALAILGVKGWNRLKAMLKKDKRKEQR